MLKEINKKSCVRPERKMRVGNTIIKLMSMLLNPFDSLLVQLQEIRDKLDYISAIPPPKGVEVITQNELCKRLGLSKPTVIRWAKKGKIPSLKIGKSVRYNWYSVIDALQKSKK